jgi:hypothetical protein
MKDQKITIADCLVKEVAKCMKDAMVEVRHPIFPFQM